ncbi:hypothetical protein C8J57DRAFT_1243861 [Mycena rebaudengoi]|nr:hypothetical protein C8J57DRAFT_1243861 [Mycena rebaudengoi]
MPIKTEGISGPERSRSATAQMLGADVNASNEIYIRFPKPGSYTFLQTTTIEMSQAESDPFQVQLNCADLVSFLCLHETDQHNATEIRPARMGWRRRRGPIATEHSHKARGERDLDFFGGIDFGGDESGHFGRGEDSRRAALGAGEDAVGAEAGRGKRQGRGGVGSWAGGSMELALDGRGLPELKDNRGMSEKLNMALAR